MHTQSLSGEVPGSRADLMTEHEQTLADVTHALHGGGCARGTVHDAYQVACVSGAANELSAFLVDRLELLPVHGSDGCLDVCSRQTAQTVSDLDAVRYYASTCNVAGAWRLMGYDPNLCRQAVRDCVAGASGETDASAAEARVTVDMLHGHIILSLRNACAVCTATSPPRRALSKRSGYATM